MAFGDGSVVDVTTDGGRLIAFAQDQTSSTSETLRAVTSVYSSADGGRTWRADDLLAPPQCGRDFAVSVM